VSACVLCGGKKNHPLYAGVLRCESCGYVFADVRLTDQQLFKLYRRDYFFGEEYIDYIADRKVLEKNFALRWKVLRRYMDTQSYPRLLEIGCAHGFFLNVVRNEFDEVRGIDVSEDGIKYAKKTLGLPVVRGDFLEKSFGRKKFDVVCLWDTIEHLRDPLLYLRKIAQLTRPGSLVAITTGDIESPNARFRGQKWRLLHPPTHLHYFSKKTLADLLDRNGFDVVYSRYCGFYRSVDNIAYNILVLRQKKKWLYELIKKSGLASWDIYLDMFDIRYVIGRKR